MRCAAGGQTATTTPSATAGPQLSGRTAGRLTLREVGIFNTTTTSFNVALARITVTGTQVGLTEVCLEDEGETPEAAASNVNSTAATVGSPVRYGILGAAIGSGIIWTFGDQGLIIPAGTANGVIIMIPTGSAPSATCMDFYFEWDE